jgi:hypothetical protein
MKCSQLMTSEPFRIKTKADRQLCMLLCDVGDSFESYQFDKVHNQIDRMHLLLKKNKSYTYVAVLKTVVDSLYQIIGVK